MAIDWTNYAVVCDNSGYYIKKYDLDTWEYLAYFPVDIAGERAPRAVTLDEAGNLYIFAEKYVYPWGNTRVFVLDKDGEPLADFSVKVAEENECPTAVKYLAGSVWAVVSVYRGDLGHETELRKFSKTGGLEKTIVWANPLWYLPEAHLAVDSQERIYVVRCQVGRFQIGRCDKNGENWEVICQVASNDPYNPPLIPYGFDILEFPQQANLLVNPSFETTQAWEFGGTAERSELDPHTGSYHARMQSQHDYITQRNIAVEDEARYVLRLWQKHPVDEALFHVEVTLGSLILRFPEAAPIAYSYCSTDSYRRAEVRFAVPEGINVCDISVYLDSEGSEIYVDDVSLQLLEEAMYFGICVGGDGTEGKPLWQKRRLNDGVWLADYGEVGIQEETAGYTPGVGLRGGPAFLHNDKFHFCEGWFPHSLKWPVVHTAYHVHLYDMYASDFEELFLPEGDASGFEEGGPEWNWQWSGVFGLGQRPTDTMMPRLGMEVAVWHPVLDTALTPWEEPVPPEPERRLRLGDYWFPETFHIRRIDADSKDARAEIPRRDGLKVGEQCLESKLIQVYGFLRAADDPAGLQGAYHLLLEAVNGGRQQLYLPHPYTSPQRVGWVNKQSFTSDYDASSFERYCHVTIGFACDDAFWESEDLFEDTWEDPIDETTHPVEVGGNAYTWPVIEVRIKTGGYLFMSLGINGDYFSLEGYVDTNDVLVIDCAEELVHPSTGEYDYMRMFGGSFGHLETGANTLLYRENYGMTATVGSIYLTWHERWY